MNATVGILVIIGLFYVLLESEALKEIVEKERDR